MKVRVLEAQPYAQVTARDPRTYHTHQQLVKPLQFELRLGPHVRSQSSLQEGHTPAGQHLSRRPSCVGVVINLEIHSNSSPYFSTDMFSHSCDAASHLCPTVLPPSSPSHGHLLSHLTQLSHLFQGLSHSVETCNHLCD